jgi:hypothetical protein
LEFLFFDLELQKTTSTFIPLITASKSLGGVDSTSGASALSLVAFQIIQGGAHCSPPIIPQSLLQSLHQNHSQAQKQLHQSS